MCVIAGYIGNELAAPILLEMLQREEGLAAGFYTGIATVHEGRLYYEKVVGDTATLIRETKALQLPGTIGIAHGRPPGGGGRELGHPFVSQNNDLAYIANGRSGQYADITDDEAHGSALLRAGHKFKSTRTEPAIYPFPVLSDGSIVHGSDIKCHAIAAAYDKLDDGPDRLLNATIDIFQRYPSEIVGICLHTKRPDEIVAARHNLPLEIGRGADGAIYLASTTIGFPSGITWTMRMPAAAGAIFHRDGSIRISPFTVDLVPLGKFPSPTTIQKRLGDMLRDRGPLSIEEIFEDIKKLWPTDVLGETEIVVFESLAAWLDEDRVEFETRQIPGVLDNTTAPRIWVHWKSPNPSL